MMNCEERRLWKIAAFGSCRVHTPLKIANDKGFLSFRSDDGIGYVHNPLEIAQAISILKGDLTPPPSLYPLLNVVNPKLLGSTERYTEAFGSADAIVVEISSLRIIKDGDWQLQINRFRGEAAKRGAPDQLMSKIFDPRYEGYVAATIEDLGLKDFFLHRKFYEMTPESLYAALCDLRSKISQPVVFVGTMQNDFTGQPIPQRVMSHEVMTHLAQDLPRTGYFDPTPLVEAAGARQSMKDLGHYADEFEPVMAGHLAAFVDGFCRSVDRAIAR